MREISSTQWRYICGKDYYVTMHTYTCMIMQSQLQIITPSPPANSSRTPGMPSPWQPTEATYLFCSTSVPCLETECLTGMKMVRLAWTLLAGWDEMTLQNSLQRTIHSWRGRWVGGRHRSELYAYKCGKGLVGRAILPRRLHTNFAGSVFHRYPLLGYLLMCNDSTSKLNLIYTKACFCMEAHIYVLLCKCVP